MHVDFPGSMLKSPTAYSLLMLDSLICPQRAGKTVLLTFGIDISTEAKWISTMQFEQQRSHTMFVYVKKHTCRGNRGP